MIFTDDKGVPFDRPKRSDYPNEYAFMLALYAWKDRITNAANKAFDEAFRKAMTRES